ncbi:MAG TPA: transposase [Fibrobacteria bacterium]|nr:transposase [Fibrobacteria bacterium]
MPRPYNDATTQRRNDATTTTATNTNDRIVRNAQPAMGVIFIPQFGNIAPMSSSDVDLEFEAAEPPRRHDSIRLRCWDYSSIGPYFVTVCSRDRRPLFGVLRDGDVVLSNAGILVARSWCELPNHLPQVSLDQWIVMPDHFHAIVWIDPEHGGSTKLGSVVGAFKSASTRSIRLHVDDPGLSVWQRGYYDRVIRAQDELDGIRRYIRDNPRSAAT